MISPFLIKAIAVSVGVALIGFAVHRLDMSRQEIGYQRAVSEYNVKLLAAQADARAQEMAWQAKQKQEQEKTNDQLLARDAAYAALSRTTDSLRNAATNYGNGLPDDTLSACRARAATLADVFGECAERLVEMGKSADGQFIDAVSCRGEWPKRPP